MSAEKGFSLIEIIVALVIAAVMSLGFLGIQRQSAFMAGFSKDTWGSLNLSQEVLALRYPDKLAVISSGWISSPSGLGSYRVSLTDASDRRSKMYLIETATDEYVSEWKVYRVPHQLIPLGK